jgi:hypothetical protein
MRIDANGWMRLQNLLPGDSADGNGKARLLNELKRPRGMPVGLELGPNGWYVIPTDVLDSPLWQYKRDVFQSYVKYTWREYNIIFLDSMLMIVPELAQNNESSPPWKALGEDYLRYHDQDCIPQGWNWVKPKDGDQDQIIKVLQRWVHAQAAGKPGLVFYNVHGVAAGLSDPAEDGKGKAVAGCQKAHWVELANDDEDESQDDRDSNNGDLEDKQPEHKSNTNKRKVAKEDFTSGEFFFNTTEGVLTCSIEIADVSESEDGAPTPKKTRCNPTASKALQKSTKLVAKAAPVPTVTAPTPAPKTPKASVKARPANRHRPGGMDVAELDSQALVVLP